MDIIRRLDKYIVSIMKYKYLPTCTYVCIFCLLDIWSFDCAKVECIVSVVGSAEWWIVSLSESKSVINIKFVN